MKVIFTRRGEGIIVDDEDFDSLSKFNWHITQGYALRNCVYEDGQRGTEKMHRRLFELTRADRVVVDHINGHRNDNRKSNLRICGWRQNLHNMGKNRRNTTGYKGVTFDKSKGKYIAQITDGARHISKSGFKTPEEAYKAYCAMATAIHGEYANIGAPKTDEVDKIIDAARIARIEERAIIKPIFTMCGLEILFSPCDYAMLSQYEWITDRSGYACCSTSKAQKHLKRLKMHRMIMGLTTGGGSFVDHKNRNRLDNRRENPRICTLAENARNFGIPRHNTSGLKGVSFHKVTGKWQSQIGAGTKGKKLHLGLHETPEEAHAAYCHAAIRLHGEFCSITEVPELPADPQLSLALA